MATTPKTLVASETFSATLDDREVLVWKGETRLSAKHPLVKKHPDLFVESEQEVAG
jgi:hypothetical protein